jgi:hypothetical protein
MVPLQIDLARGTGRYLAAGSVNHSSLGALSEASELLTVLLGVALSIPLGARPPARTHRQTHGFARYLTAWAVWLRMRSVSSGHSGRGRSWPMSWTRNRLAPGTSSAVRSPPAGRIKVSALP